MKMSPRFIDASIKLVKRLKKEYLTDELQEFIDAGRECGVDFTTGERIPKKKKS